MPIKIAVDIRDNRKAFSGTKTYLDSLIGVWKANTDAEFEFVFLDDPFTFNTGKNKILKLYEHFAFLFWKQVRLPFLVWVKGCKILFCTDYFLPFFQPGFKTVIVFHDAFFFEYPNHYNKIWLWLFKNIAIPSAQKSAAIITPSLYSKQRISYFVTLDENKIKVIYEAPSEIHSNSPEYPNNKLLQEVAAKKFILHVGTLNKNKNLVRLINAFKTVITSFPDEDIFLVLAGKASTHSALNDEENIRSAILQNELKEKIVLTGFLTKNDLAYAFNHAFCYVFPSYNEGFGIPVLEAFKYNLPLIAANNTCLPEIAGDAALYFDPYNEKEIADTILLLLNNESLKAELKKKGKLRLQNFSWEKTSNQINEIFKEIINK